jgi:bifunctional DNA-binding transcriptional regulator/antitoxin component of YhaV-PrlF toxin-antitoxin module
MMLRFRRMDKLGRLNIPWEIRREVGAMGDHTPFHVRLDGKQIILEKAKLTCLICGTDKALIMNPREESFICKECLRDFTERGRELKEEEECTG